MFLTCTFACIVHQLVLSRYAYVLHLFFIIVCQFQLQFLLPLMSLTSVGAISSFLPRRCHIPCTMMVFVELCVLLEERESHYPLC